MIHVAKPDLSIILVSYNTVEITRRCLRQIPQLTKHISSETIAVDNNSRDDSAAMIRKEFPWVKLIHSATNLGFAVANNHAFSQAKGRYLLLLNPDALLMEGELSKILQRMDQNPDIALVGGQLIDEDSSWCPSARQFPSILGDLCTLSGLSTRYPGTRFFGWWDRTWAPTTEEADVDWIPGAFNIIRHKAVKEIGGFDERFFLYYEEVDLCHRLKNAGYRICYWPKIVVQHIGGESAKTLDNDVVNTGSQLALWRMQSQLLYYRKRHGFLMAWGSFASEYLWHMFRIIRHGWNRKEPSRSKFIESNRYLEQKRRAWRNTAGGKSSPLHPWTL